MNITGLSAPCKRTTSGFTIVPSVRTACESGAAPAVARTEPGCFQPGRVPGSWNGAGVGNAPVSGAAAPTSGALGPAQRSGALASSDRVILPCCSKTQSPSVRTTAARNALPPIGGGHIDQRNLRRRVGPFLKEFVKRKRFSSDRLRNGSAERGSRLLRLCWSRPMLRSCRCRFSGFVSVVVAAGSCDRSWPTRLLPTHSFARYRSRSP